MMLVLRITFLYTVLAYCGALALPAQSIRGTVKDQNAQTLGEATIMLKGTPHQTKTDKQGRYLLKDIPQGKYTLLAFSLGKATEERAVEMQGTPLEFDFILLDISQDLEGISLEAKHTENGLTRMRSVENFGIYEGKKTEVIVLKDITANLSTNNPRQIYSQITGLNIWESDGVGLQLGIGGRGLSPNRTANFNTRQNGYDISADALGYPETYYTPPVEALERIEVVRGAASLQYGTQFGGMLNFRFKQGAKDKPIELVSRQSVGSWGYFGSFNSIGGTVGKLNYYAFLQYKTGQGYRPNSGFSYQNAFISLTYNFSERLSITADMTKMRYLAQQAGGLTDKNFQDNPRQSFRNRNWFLVDWNLPALQLTYRVNDNIKINSRFFGLVATRQSLGNLDRINVADRGENRTLIAGNFENMGNETRYLQNYEWAGKPMAFLAGFRAYKGFSTARQDIADNGSGANFSFLNQTSLEGFSGLVGLGISDYAFPNENYSIFAENIFNITEKWSVTPGIRYESISTFSNGMYKRPLYDGAGNLLAENQQVENLARVRDFAIFGVGMSYKMKESIELYGNFSQNYRAINFTDLRIVNPNFVVDPNIQDEKGYNLDLGLRGDLKGKFSFELTGFYLAYKGRIGQILRTGQAPLYLDYRYRGNIADARNFGVEFLGKWNTNFATSHTNNLSIFLNFAWVDARYINTQDNSIKDKRVEMVPPIMLRTGISWRYKQFATTLQWAYTAEHYSDATNATRTATAVEGLIPAYHVGDFSVRYTWKMLTFEGSVNNVLDTPYFTRRAESYPGPGIIPADGRGFYATVQLKL